VQKLIDSKTISAMKKVVDALLRIDHNLASLLQTTQRC
jgi:hypothetical protein